MTVARSIRGDSVPRGHSIAPVSGEPLAAGTAPPAGRLDPPDASHAANSHADTATPPAAWDWILQLERLSQSGVMAAGFASSVLNALTAVAGTCQLGMLERDSARVRDALARAGEIAMRAAESANVFLTFVRPVATPPPVARCATVVDDALRFVAPAVRAVSAVVDVDVPEDLGVACDRARLLQSVIDVLVFLLRSDGEPGVLVRVSASRHEDVVTIRVQDDGCGLRPSVRACAFEPFLHGTASATGETPLGERSGLGLFLTRRIVEDLGGTIEIEPCVPHGTAVSLRLPAANEDGERGAARRQGAREGLHDDPVR